MKIYQLEVYSKESSFLRELKKEKTKPSFPLDLFCSNSYHSFTDYFSSKEKTLEHYNSVYNELDQEDKKNVVYFSITTHELDSNDFIESQTYSSKSELLRTFTNEDQIFLGEDNPAYKLGDWILYFDNGCLMVGKIGHLPYTTNEVKTKKMNLTEFDNMYYVFYADPQNPQDDYPHSHLHPSHVLEVIKEEDVCNYLSQSEIDSIESRYKKP